jgi:hypothetical protein
MPYVDTTGDVVRTSSFFSYANGQVQETVWHWALAAAGAADTRAALASHIATIWATRYTNEIDTTTIFKGITVHMAKSVAKWAPVMHSANNAGNNTTHNLPTQVRGLLSLKTDMAGHAYRGRSYLPTPAQDRNSIDGHPSTTHITACQQLANDLLVPYVTAGSTWVLVVFHRKPTADIGAAYSNVAAASMQGKWATQRRGGDYGRLNVSPI